MPQEAQSASPGSLGVIGGFELLEPIGQGAMGTVYRARQLSLDRIVALKVLPPSFAEDQRFTERFQREARAVASLANHHIVQAIDSGRDAKTGLWYFAMEYVDGPSLGRVLKEKGALPERQVLGIARQVAEALECAHTNRIVHRDIKPDNILLTRTGEAKLADLGLARRTGEAEAALGKPGQTMGTPNYMAPEQIRGELDQIDVRTDLYALGGTLFHLVTGQPPFSGPTNAAIMAKQLTEKPPLAHRISDRVNEPFSRLICQLMQKDPTQRIQTPTELIAQLDRILDLTVSRKRPAVRVTTGPRAPVRGTERRMDAVVPPTGAKSSTVPLVIGAVVLLAVAVGGGGWYFLSGQNKPAKESAESPRERPAAPIPKPELKPTPIPEKPTESAALEPAKKALADTEKPAPPEPEKKGAGEPAKTVPEEEAGLTIGKKEEPPPAAVENGFRIESFEGQAFQTLRTVTFAPTLDVTWPTGGPPGVALGSGVTARWTGFVKPPEDGPYCFEIAAAQGARLYLDRCLLSDLWSGRPATGRTAPVNLEKAKKYFLTFELRCGRPPASAQVRWGPPDGPLTPLTGDAPSTEAEGAPVGHLTGGWQVTYGQSGADRTPVTGREWTIDHSWGSGPPAAGVGNDRFWATWRGVVVPSETGDYTFLVDVNQGARLFISGALVLDVSNLPPGKAATAPLRLEKGKRYALLLEYHKRGDEALCKLQWSKTGQPPSVVVAVAEGEEDLAGVKTGFLAEYGDGNSPKALVTRHETQAGWDWRGGSPDPSVPGGNFWATYTGWIRPAANGVYSFILERDGNVRLLLDDCLLLEGPRRRDPAKEPQDLVTMPLEGGKHYFVRLEFRARQDSKHLLFKWRSNDMAEQLVTAVPPDALQGGDKDAGRLDHALLAEYGTVKEPIVKRLESWLSHDFGSGTPSADIPGGPYWGRWSGGLRVKESGPYAFQLETDNTAEMKLNRTSVLKLSKAGKLETRAVQLQKGTTCFLELAYAHRSGDTAVFKLTWKPPGKTEFEPLPAEVLLLPPDTNKTFVRAVPK
jgi:serine/threonine protein kinase